MKCFIEPSERKKERILQLGQELYDVECYNFATFGFYKDFLFQNGYHWSGWYLRNDGISGLSRVCKFWNDDELVGMRFCEPYGSYVIFDDIDSYAEGIIDVFEDSRVRYFQQDLTTFKVCTVYENTKYHRVEDFDGKRFVYKMEKDLSKQWRKYLAKNVPYYTEYVLKICEERAKEINQNMEDDKNLLAKRIEELHRNAEEKRALGERELRKYEKMKQTIKKLKDDLQV